MYYLDGISSKIKSITILASLNQKTPYSLDDLRTAYIEFSRNAIGDPYIPVDHGSQYCFDEYRIDLLIRKYLGKTDIDDLSYTVDPTSNSSRISAWPAIQSGKNHLIDIAPDLAALFDLVIHTMLYQRTSDSVGGSASSTLGVV